MCTPLNVRKLKLSSMEDILKQEEMIQDILKKLEGWKKIINFNMTLKTLHASGQRKINERQRRTINEEVKLASRALLLIRRAALKELLETEYQQYLEELHQKGMTIYKERI
ncbi:cilia- and flagella-associated protein 141-like [Heterodontus francisci]|uniref:cilia- and flagella-associated protein 141-like n=1 Tax=Heterodontus francisci TaxID=7792 RepID=UPI00355AE519